MEVTKDQLRAIIQNAPIGTNPRQVVEGLLARGHTLEGFSQGSANVAQSNVQTEAVTTGNQFQKPKEGFLGQARNFVADFIGGKKLAEGAGQALAAGGVQKDLAGSLGIAMKQQDDILSRLRQARAQGQDTSELTNALRLNQNQIKQLTDANTDFVDSLTTNKEVVGSAARLAGTAIAAPLAKTASGITGAGKAATITGGIARGAGAGAITGAVEGGIQGAGIALENNADARGVARGIATGATTGALLGGAVGGVAGGIQGAANKGKSIDALLERVTPKTNELPEGEYKKLLAQGRVTPKTATKPAQIILPEDVKKTAIKYQEVINGDPVRTIENISQKIGDIDDEVGGFLQKNNSIYNDGELRNALYKKLEDLDDITVPEERIKKAKDLLVENFLKSVEKNDMESLWLARKNFDRSIEGAFKGSPTLNKQVQIAVRDAVQDFIAERTPDTRYADAMFDMSRLFDLRDSVALKAGKERTLSAIQAYLARHPEQKWLAYTAGGIYAFNVLQGSIGKAVGGSE